MAMGGLATASRETETTVAMQELQKVTEELQGKVEALECRLQAVLRPQADPVPTEKAPGCLPSAPLPRALDQICSSLTGILDRAARCLDRLEI